MCHSEHILLGGWWSTPSSGEWLGVAFEVDLFDNRRGPRRRQGNWLGFMQIGTHHQKLRPNLNTNQVDLSLHREPNLIINRITVNANSISSDMREGHIHTTKDPFSNRIAAAEDEQEWPDMVLERGERGKGII